MNITQFACPPSSELHLKNALATSIKLNSTVKGKYYGVAQWYRLLICVLMICFCCGLQAERQCCRISDHPRGKRRPRWHQWRWQDLWGVLQRRRVQWGGCDAGYRQVLLENTFQKMYINSSRYLYFLLVSLEGHTFRTLQVMVLQMDSRMRVNASVMMMSSSYPSSPRGPQNDSCCPQLNVRYWKITYYSVTLTLTENWTSITVGINIRLNGSSTSCDDEYGYIDLLWYRSFTWKNIYKAFMSVW